MTGTRAITLHQPWATLVALGVKSIETRSWPAPAGAIGERLLIHAAAKVPPVSVVGDHSLVHPPWRVIFDMTGERQCFLADPFTEEQQVARGMQPDGDLLGFPMPLGAIVASCTLAACVPMVAPRALNDDRTAHLSVTPQSLVLYEPTPNTAANWTHRSMQDQMPYGDFAPGRWAWLLEDVKPTTERCPACWGAGGDYEEIDGEEWDWACDVCEGALVCPPVPAKGAQRIWWWTP